MGFQVKLDTNGQNPRMLEWLFQEDLVDYVAMDIKHVWEKYPLLVGKEENISLYKESVHIIMDRAPNYEFRTTVIGGIHTPNDIEDIARYIDDAKQYFLQIYRKGDSLDMNFMGRVPLSEEVEEMKKRALLYIERCNIRN